MNYLNRRSYYKSVTPLEWILGAIIFAISSAITLSIAHSIYSYWRHEYIVYLQAPKITLEDEFRYTKETNVGNVMAYGSAVATEPVQIDDIEGEYSKIEKVKQRYTRHTRVETYSCGESTCTRTETYYTWDQIDNEIVESKTLMFLGVELQLCKPDSSTINNLEEVYKGKFELHNNYAYEDKPSWLGASVGDIRYYYKQVPTEFKTTVFVRFFDDKIMTSKESTDKCIESHANKNIEQVLKNKEPKWFLILCPSLLILVGIVAAYLKIAYEGHII